MQDSFVDTADLIQDSFNTLAEAAGLPNGRAAQKLEARARLQMGAAQAIATLTLAQEVRSVALLLASRAAPLGHDAVNPELTGAAYTAAATHLGLVEPEPVDIEELRARLLNDPADADVEL
jgi:hypothetical protein